MRAPRILHGPRNGRPQPYHDDMSGTWLFWVFASVIALFGAALLGWSLFPDRSRGRKRCPNCGYSMNEAPSLRCPECGCQVMQEKHLYRSRRRWKWAMASLVPFAIATFLLLWPKMQRDGVGSVVPVTVLIFFLEFDDSGWIINGIAHHIDPDTSRHIRDGTATGDTLWRWQWRWLGRSVLNRIGDEDYDPYTHMRYHDWLSGSRDFSEDSALREKITQAFVRDISHTDVLIRRSAVVFSVDPTDVDGSLARVLPLLLYDDDERVPHSALFALALIARNSGTGVAPLLEALEHHDPVVRRSAVAAIARAVAEPGQHDHLPGAYEAVLAMKDDPDGDVRERRIQTLARFQSDEEAWDTIKSAWQGDDPYARRGALYAAIGRSPRPDFAALMVIEALDDQDNRLRVVAIHNLRHYLESEMFIEHVDQLEALVDHEDPDVRDAVNSMLGRLKRR